MPKTEAELCHVGMNVLQNDYCCGLAGIIGSSKLRSVSVAWGKVPEEADTSDVL